MKSYYLKQSQSYFSDILKNYSYCNVTGALLLTYISIDRRVVLYYQERLSKYKIIGMGITSKNLRGLKKKQKKLIKANHRDFSSDEQVTESDDFEDELENKENSNEI
jgi:hypothetical protein